jgi:hypothetical protein
MVRFSLLLLLLMVAVAAENVVLIINTRLLLLTKVLPCSSGLYGFCSVQSCSFNRTRIVAESTLSKVKSDPSGLIKTRGLDDGDLVEVSLLGAVCKEGKKPDLLYSLTSRQPKKDIYNVVQISGAILGESRCIFLGKVSSWLPWWFLTTSTQRLTQFPPQILCLLRYFNPGCMEIIYCGKSSCCWLGSCRLQD